MLRWSGGISALPPGPEVIVLLGGSFLLRGGGLLLGGCLLLRILLGRFLFPGLTSAVLVAWHGDRSSQGSRICSSEPSDSEAGCQRYPKQPGTLAGWCLRGHEVSAHARDPHGYVKVSST